MLAATGIWVVNHEEIVWVFNKRRTEDKVELEYRKKRKGADDSEEEIWMEDSGQ